MYKLIVLVTATVMLGAFGWAQTPYRPETARDKKEIRKDAVAMHKDAKRIAMEKKSIHRDKKMIARKKMAARKEMRHIRKDQAVRKAARGTPAVRHALTKDIRKEKRQLARKNASIAMSKKDIGRNHRALKNDRKSLAKDKKDLRSDFRDLRNDRQAK